MRLIDAEKLRTIRSIQSGDFNSIETIQKWIDNAPTANAERHGVWENKPHKMMGESPCCSVCGGFNPIETKFCPNCGAVMDNAIQWQWEEDDGNLISNRKCSECLHAQNITGLRIDCSNCGAKMDESTMGQVKPKEGERREDAKTD